MRFGLLAKLFLAFVGMFLLTYFFPIIHIDNSGTILSAATFLYGILYGFETFRVLNNFTLLKNNIAIENAGILSLYYLSKILGGDTGKKVGDRVEEYLIAAINTPLSDHLAKTDKEFYEIFGPLKDVQIQGQHENYALNYIYEGFYYIPPARNQIAQLAPRDIGTSEWFILIILSILLIGILLLARAGDAISLFSTVIFATTVIESLLILDEFDSNKIKESELEYEVFNESLKAMGKLPYYPESAIRKGLVKLKKGNHYRIGKMVMENNMLTIKISYL